MQTVIGRILTPISFAAFVAFAAPAQAVTPAAAVQELINADKQFSEDGEGKNIVDAIAAMLDENAIAPTPDRTFAKGKQAVVDVLRSNPANATATADWAPVRGGISADGLQGFTFGFQTIHHPGEPDQRVKYLAYWMKRGAGWRVLAYKRVLSPPGEVSTALRAPAVPALMLPERRSPQLVDKYRDSLAAREKAFSARASEVGLRQAFLEFGSADAMNRGAGSDFVYGNVAISEGFPTDVPPGLIWGPDEGVTVSSTGDLGVTFGYIRFTDQLVSIPFFTIWRRSKQNGTWLYVAEL